LGLCHVSLKYVPPQTWKKFHGIPPKSDKEYSRGLVMQMRPDLAKELARKKDHNRAEAVLIALYGQYKEK
jgi:crossover junction endodeoxyribonuclease RuvC